MKKLRTGAVVACCAGGVLLLVAALWQSERAGDGLTGDDRAVWRELRDTRGGRSRWLVVLGPDGTRWQSYTSGGLLPGVPGTVFREEDGGRPEQFARALVRGPGTRVAAVCDIYGGESPAPAAWFWRDGGEVRSSPHPPEDWMDASLRRYLLTLQEQVVRQHLLTTRREAGG